MQNSELITVDRKSLVSVIIVFLVALPAPAAETKPQAPSTNAAATSQNDTHNIPSMVEADGKLRLDFGEEHLVLPRGLQPSLLSTSAGTLILQSQLPDKPFPSNRMTYPYALSTVVSRDNGKTWTPMPLKPGENGLNMEGGALQLKDSTIVALDTYIMPGKTDGTGVGQLYTSTDDWRTLEGPKDVPFDLPNVNFEGSSDDGGRPHNAQRLHRRIIEMPNGDLLTTFYGWLKGDKSPSTYRPSMIRTRMMLARSTDKGQSWKLVSSAAIDPTIGTEGLGEPVVCRVNKGPNAGRLICLMRTGRNLYETVSDDEGASWSPPRPRIFAGLDVDRTELWVDMFRNFKDFHGKLLDENNLDELRGAVVDPDLIELRSGMLVAAFGVRVPQKLCWQHPEHPWNGNYLAFSDDHGATWKNVVRMTSGVLTTHYMAVEETPTDGLLYVAYDLGGWSKGMRRDIYGRTVKVGVKR
jgi:hypothetical protein